MTKEMKEKALKIEPIVPIDSMDRFVPPIELRVPAREVETEPEKFVARGITELGNAMARHSIGEVSPLTPNDTASDEKIAKALAEVEIDDPNLEKPDISTDQGIAEAAALTIAKAKATARESSDPKVKAELENFGDRIAAKIAKLYATPMTRKRFLKTATTGLLTLILISCGINPASPTISPPDATATQPVSTEVSPAPTQTLTPTETPTPEAIFVPEGFQIGELGLLQNPETGRDTFQFNPEVDWKAEHQREVQAYYELVKVWGKFTGQTNDANRYSFETFYQKALAGERLNVPRPVRVDITGEDLVDTPKSHVDPFKWGRFYCIRFIPVEGGIRLDKIRYQILAPEEFKSFLGVGWSDRQNEAFSVYPNGIDVPAMASSPIHFSVDQEGYLVITTGSLYFKPQGALTIGIMGHYDETGQFILSEEADFVVSSIVNLFLEEAMNIKDLTGPRVFMKTKNGSYPLIVIAGSSAYPGDPEEGQYPQLFTFGP